MRAMGLQAFRQRTEAKSGTYSYEQRETAALRKLDLAQLKKHPAAWKYFSSRPLGYRRLASYWVVSAKREETRRKRLGLLISYSAAGRPIGPLEPPS